MERQIFGPRINLLPAMTGHWPQQSLTWPQGCKCLILSRITAGVLARQSSRLPNILYCCNLTKINSAIFHNLLSSKCHSGHTNRQMRDSLSWRKALGILSHYTDNLYSSEKWMGDYCRRKRNWIDLIWFFSSTSVTHV